MHTNDSTVITKASDSFRLWVTTANSIALKMQMIGACLSKFGRRPKSQHSRFEATIELFEFELKIIVSFEIRVDMCRRKALIACTNKHNDVITYDVTIEKGTQKLRLLYNRFTTSTKSF